MLLIGLLDLTNLLSTSHRSLNLNQNNSYCQDTAFTGCVGFCQNYFYKSPDVFIIFFTDYEYLDIKLFVLSIPGTLHIRSSILHSGLISYFTIVLVWDPPCTYRTHPSGPHFGSILIIIPATLLHPLVISELVLILLLF